jgi:hypothetical protein
VKDPKRLCDDEGAPFELRRLLAAAEDDVLDDAATARVRAAMLVPAARMPEGRPSARWPIAARPLVVATLAGALALTALVALRYQRSPVPAPSLAERASVAPPIVERAPMASPSAVTSATASAITSAPRSAAVRFVQPGGSHRVAASPEPDAREGLLLLLARRALDQDPERALALVAQHEREFPKSQLAPERDRLRAQALARRSAPLAE